VDVRKHRAADS